MLYVTVTDGSRAQSLLDDEGVRCLSVSQTELRLVTHLDVDDDGIASAISAFEALKSQLCPQD